MTRIQSFEEFSKGASAQPQNHQAADVLTEATDKDKVVKITPQAGEVARWRVVLKKGSENIADNAVPQVIAELAKDKDFKAWWNTDADVRDEGTNSTQRAKGSQLIAFAHKVKEVDKNLFGKEVAKYEIGFRTYTVIFGGQTYVNYDVAKAQPSGKTKVEGSDTPLVVWSDESMKTMELADKKTVGGKEVYSQTSPAIQSALSTAASSTSTTNTTTVAPTASTGSATGKYANLKLDPKTANPTVKELQTAILKLNNPASAKIKAVGGADGKYGKATATAIGILIGTNKEENTITPEIAAKLDVELAKAPATQATTTDTTTAAANAGTQKTTASSTKTPGGKTVIF